MQSTVESSIQEIAQWFISIFSHLWNTHPLVVKSFAAKDLLHG